MASPENNVEGKKEVAETAVAAAKPARHFQFIRGVVVSDKMNKTRVIEIKRTKSHRLYNKRMITKRRLMVHDEKNECKVGDVVDVVSMRALSRHKNFRLSKIVTRKVAE